MDISHVEPITQTTVTLRLFKFCKVSKMTLHASGVFFVTKIYTTLQMLISLNKIGNFDTSERISRFSVTWLMSVTWPYQSCDSIFVHSEVSVIDCFGTEKCLGILQEFIALKIFSQYGGIHFSHNDQLYQQARNHTCTFPR